MSQFCILAVSYIFFLVFALYAVRLRVLETRTMKTFLVLAVFILYTVGVSVLGGIFLTQGSIQDVFLRIVAVIFLVSEVFFAFMILMADRKIEICDREHSR